MGTDHEEGPFTGDDVDFVKKTLTKLGVREGARDDVASEVLLDACEQPDAGAAKSARLYGFARVAAQAHRQQARTREARELLVAEPELASDGPDPEERTIGRDRLEMVDGLLDELPVQEVDVLLAAELSPKKLAEIAAAHGVPHGTASTWLRKARKRLHAARARLVASLRHQGEDWVVVPPIPLLFDTAHEQGGLEASPDKPSGGRWLRARAPAFVAGLAAGAALVAALRFPPPSPSPIVPEQIAIVTSSPSVPPPPVAPSVAPVPKGALSVLETPDPPPPPTHAPSPAPRIVTKAKAKPTKPEVDEFAVDKILATLDAARFSIRGGDPAAALTALDEADQRDAAGAYWDDRAMMRIEALMLQDRVQEARALARGIRDREPNHAFMDRLRELLDDSQ